MERPGNYWYMLPEYSQARKSMWDAVNPHTGKRRIDEAFPQEIRKFTRENEMMIGLGEASTFQLVGSDNFNSLVGSPPIGLVFSEYALSDPSAWGYLMPIIEENGGWVGFNSTPRGKNHFQQMCKLAEKEPGWFYQSLTADQTQVFTAEQLLAILRQLQATYGEDYGKALWLQEYYVSFDAAIPGSIWGDCIAKAEAQERIRDVPVDPAFLVNTAFDLGRTDDTAIWFFQVIAGEIKIVDYHASNFKDIPFYGNLLREWKIENGINYGTHYIPHDARPRTLAAGGKSMLQQFNSENVGRFVIAPRLDVQEGIQAARATFPRCFFDRTRCEDGIECLRHYHREWDEDEKCFLDHPHHDWSSHAADAFRYLSLVWKQAKQSDPVTPVEERMMRASIHRQTMGEVRKKLFDQKRRERADTVH